MPISDADLWHQVHAQREDGVPAMFMIREVEPRADQPRLLVIEMPYTSTEASKLPDTAAYRQLDTLQEEWIEPACEALDWTFVAWKSEDGSFFLYIYGGGDPSALLERLASFDGALGFFNDSDADWSEYAALRELVAQAHTAPEGADEDEDEDEDDHVHTAGCGHEQAADDTSEEFPPIDLTGVTDERDERPSQPRAAKAGTLKPPRPAKTATAKARTVKAIPAKTKATKAKATKAKATNAKATNAKATNAKATNAKATNAKTTKAKATNAKATNAKAAKSASVKPALTKARPTASRATSRPTPHRVATAQKPRK